jgi:excisionase family DNA binding protein
MADRTHLSPTLTLTRREFAAKVGVHVNSVDRLIRRGQLRVVRLGNRVLIPRTELTRLGLLDVAAISPMASDANRGRRR